MAWEKSGKPYAQTSSFVSVYVLAIEAQDHKLLSQSWPAGAIADIDALVRGDAAVEGVVAVLAGLASSSSDTDWFIAYSQDAATAVANANIVRRDPRAPPGVIFLTGSAPPARHPARSGATRDRTVMRGVAECGNCPPRGPTFQSVVLEYWPPAPQLGLETCNGAGRRPLRRGGAPRSVCAAQNGGG